MRYTDVYDHRTGDPWHDNEARKAEKALRRALKGYIRFDLPHGGRRRRAVVTRIELANYFRLVAVLGEAAFEKNRGQKMGIKHLPET